MPEEKYKLFIAEAIATLWATASTIVGILGLFSKAPVSRKRPANTSNKESDSVKLTQSVITNLPKSQPSFALKDFVTLGISILALTISAATFYFNNFRIDNKLQARIVDQTLDTPFKDKQEYIVVKVSFYNAGNRPAYVLNTEYYLAHPNREYIAEGTSCVTNEGTFPLLLQPHDVRLVDLGIPMSHVISAIESGSSAAGSEHAQSDQFSESEELFYYLEFVSLDNNGEYYSVKTDFFGSVAVNKQGMKEVGPIKGKKYVPIDLFHKN